MQNSQDYKQDDSIIKLLGMCKFVADDTNKWIPFSTAIKMPRNATFLYDFVNL